MTSRVTEIIVDCHDIDRLLTFWCAALGYQRGNTGDGWAAIGERPPDQSMSDAELRSRAPAPLVAFVVVPEDKATKNRLHIDLTPIDATRDEEVERLIGLGASHADIGQVDVPWVVLADPEGNEFCVMPGLDEEGD